MQTVSQPSQQALFTLSHNLLALTDYPTSLGPTLVFDSGRFALLPSHSLCSPLSPSIFYGSLSGNPNSFIFPSDKDLADLTSGLTENISERLLKMKRRCCEALCDEGKGLDLHNLSISASGCK